MLFLSCFRFVIVICLLIKKLFMGGFFGLISVVIIVFRFLYFERERDDEKYF